MTRTRRVVPVTLVALLWLAPAHADPVIDWNAIAVTAAANGRPGPVALLDLALVQAAVHDAVQAIERRYQPFHYDASAVGSPTAAVAAAAHRVLWLLYPSQRSALGVAYNNYQTTHRLASDPGIAIGEAAALAVYTAHYRPPQTLPPYLGRTGTGEWRSSVPMAYLELAFLAPFTLDRIDQFRPPPPPPIVGTTYARDYDEVKALGAASAHPNEATEIAWFWSVNYVTQWNETLRQIAGAKLSTVGERARLFALANLAAADAAMAIWDSKYFYNYWRPVTAIQEGGADGNPRTAADDAWTPLFPTPPYPDYVSGANGLTGAFTGMLRLFYATDAMEFTVKTTSPNVRVANCERAYTAFSEPAQEVVDARVLLGSHFRFADEEGRRLGERVAEWTFQKVLGPAAGAK